MTYVMRILAPIALFSTVAFGSQAVRPWLGAGEVAADEICRDA